MSLLGVFNSTAFGTVLTRERDRFNTLFKRRAMLHHYLEFIDVESVAEAERWSAAISAEYSELENGTFNGRNRRHFQPKSVGATGSEEGLGGGPPLGVFREPVLFPSF